MVVRVQPLVQRLELSPLGFVLDVSAQVADVLFLELEDPLVGVPVQHLLDA